MNAISRFCHRWIACTIGFHYITSTSACQYCPRRWTRTDEGMEWTR